MKNLNEIIKENEEVFDRVWHETRKGYAGISNEQIKSHLHQSQLNIVKYIKERIQDTPKDGTEDDEFYWVSAKGVDELLEELDKIV